MCKLTCILLLALILVFRSNLRVTYAAKAFSEDEIEALKKFRPMVEDVLTKDYEKTDIFLIRWLRAKEMDINKAEKMLRAAQKWRKENRIDGILKEHIWNFKNPPFVIDGVDKYGSPIVTLFPARVDTRKAIIQGKEAQMIRYFDQFMETVATKIREADAESPRNITSNVNIYDFTNYNRQQHGCLGCFPIYIEWVRHYENYYPGLSKMLVFVNFPRIAVPVVEAITPVMSPLTRKTFKVFGPDRQEWGPFLQKYINADQLTHQFGGTRKPH